MINSGILSSYAVGAMKQLSGNQVMICYEIYTAR